MLCFAKGDRMENSNREYNKKTGIFDMNVLLDNGFKGLKQYWWIFICLISICSSAFYMKERLTYKPLYKASATFVISINRAVSYSNEYYSNATASQMSKTFPYILNSGVLKKVVADDLGVDDVWETIAAQSLEDSNMFELSVTGEDPQRTYDVLQSVIENYPSVAEFVIGDTQLYMIDETGVPEEPQNPADFMAGAKRGAQIGGILCLVILGVYATTRNTIRKEEDFKRMLNIRCMGSIPLVRFKKRSLERDLVLLNNKKIPPGFVEATRTIRTRLLKECKEKNLKTLLVSSSMPGEGKSTVAVNLAISLEQMGYQILLVDGDMRHPSLAKALGIEKKTYAHGFKDVITGNASLSEAVFRYGETGISLLLGSDPIESTERLLSKRATAEVLYEAGRQVDFVIVDTPPGGMLADASILAEYADGMVFVVRQDWVRSDRVLEAVQLMSDTGIHMAGCVLNCVQNGITGYGSGYSRYGGRYGSHYGSGAYGYGYGYGSNKRSRWKKEN